MMQRLGAAVATIVLLVLVAPVGLATAEYEPTAYGYDCTELVYDDVAISSTVLCAASHQVDSGSQLSDEPGTSSSPPAASGETRLRQAADLVAPNSLVPGPNGAMRDTSTGQFAPNPNRVPEAPSSGTHGNSRSSEAPTSLYQLYDDAGNYLKTGVTGNPGGRYPSDFMRDKYMDIINTGSRGNMLDLERMIVEIDPGPLNLEPWAGVGR